MKKLFVFILLIHSVINLLGQMVSILDSKTKRPIENAIVFSSRFTTQTNREGIFNSNQFADNEEITIQHTSYLKYKTTKRIIRLHQNKVLLVENPITLQDVVVSVSRREQLKTEIPNTIISINALDVIRQNPPTTADLAGMKGEVYIQKSQQGGGSPMIRGFSANRLLLVVDGIRLNNAIYRSGNLQNIVSLDANSIENAEIIPGPGSVIYGSDALGGVLSFNTFRPRLNTSKTIKADGLVMSGYASSNNGKTYHGRFNAGDQKLAFLVSSTYSDFGNLKMGKHGPEEYLRPEYVVNQTFNGTDIILKNPNPRVQKFTSYSQFNLLAKARYRPTENLDFIVAAHFSATTDVPRYDRLIVYKNKVLRFGDWFYGPQKWMLLSTQTSYKTSTLLFNRIDFIAGYQKYAESRHDRNLNDQILNHRFENLSIATFNLDFNKKPDQKNQITYGLEGAFNRVHSSGEAENLMTAAKTILASRYPDNSVYQSFASYASYQLNFSKIITFNAGVRFTTTMNKGIFNKEFYNFPELGFKNNNHALNGNIGMVFRQSDKLQLNINASTGFRAPNIDDIAKVFDSEPGNVVVPNPGLKPEYARNIETGIIYRPGNKVKIEVTAFYTRLVDAMVRRPFKFNGLDSMFYNGVKSKVEALVNADAATVYGFNFSAGHLLTNKLRMQHSVTLMDGKDSDMLPLRHVPPTFGTSRIIFENQVLFAELNAQYNGKKLHSKLAAEEKDKPYLYASDNNGKPYSPAWWTLNFKLSATLFQNLQLNAGIENILDVRYRPYSSGIAAPGRNFILSLVANW